MSTLSDQLNKQGQLLAQGCAVGLTGSGYLPYMSCSSVRVLPHVCLFLLLEPVYVRFIQTMCRLLNFTCTCVQEVHLCG